jgi:DNA-binding transcriptional LysR family regulator
VHVRPDHIIRRRAHLITAALTPELKRPALRTLPSTTFLTPRCVADDAKVLVPKGSFRTNDAEEIRAAVLTDPGLAHAPGWLFARELASDAVRLVLRDYEPEPLLISAVRPGGRRLPTKLRVFIDFLAGIFSEEPTLALRPPVSPNPPTVRSGTAR